MPVSIKKWAQGVDRKMKPSEKEGFDLTRQYWQCHYAEKLGQSDVLEIIDSVSGFVALVRKWSNGDESENSSQS